MIGAIAVAAIVLAGVLFAVRLGGSGGESRRTVTVEDLFGTSTPNTNPPASSATTAPGATSTTRRPSSSVTSLPARSDLTITYSDSEGRFAVSVPRTWKFVPLEVDKAVQWEVQAADSAGTLADTGIKFSVQWADNKDLSGCADQIDQGLRQRNAGTVTRQATTVNGKEAVRIDGVGTDNHLTAWVVTDGGRCWVPQIVSPTQVYDAAESIALAVVDTFKTA